MTEDDSIISDLELTGARSLDCYFDFDGASAYVCTLSTVNETIEGRTVDNITVRAWDINIGRDAVDNLKLDNGHTIIKFTHNAKCTLVDAEKVLKKIRKTYNTDEIKCIGRRNMWR